MREYGYNGLSVVSGRVLEECNYELQWPHFIRTIKKMRKDATVAPSVDYVQNKMGNVTWYVKAPKGYEEELKDETLFLTTLMGDMEHSWLSFIKEASSFVHAGFCIHEIVPRYRLKSKGSKFNDGYIGIKKLALRSQDTILGWNYSNKGRDLKSVVQLKNIPTNYPINYPYNYASLVENLTEDSKVEIPISKCLLFRNNPDKDSPFGSSPLCSVWRAWKYKTAYEEVEAQGVSGDVSGLKVLKMPAQYMSENASAEQKETYAYFQKALRNMHIGQESGLTIPSDSDLNGKPMFDFDVVSVSSNKAYDVDKIIRRYQAEITTTLYATFLRDGQSGGGSFALSNNTNKLADEVTESKLETIRDELNHKLIPYIFKINGWEAEVYPTFEFTSVSQPTLEEKSKAAQRLGAVGLIARTPKNINKMGEWLEFEPVPEDISQEDLATLLGKDTSRSGDGMASGMPSGTGSATGGGDKSSSNNENKA